MSGRACWGTRSRPRPRAGRGGTTVMERRGSPRPSNGRWRRSRRDVLSGRRGYVGPRSARTPAGPARRARRGHAPPGHLGGGSDGRRAPRERRSPPGVLVTTSREDRGRPPAPAPRAPPARGRSQRRRSARDCHGGGRARLPRRRLPPLGATCRTVRGGVPVDGEHVVRTNAPGGRLRCGPLPAPAPTGTWNVRPGRPPPVGTPSSATGGPRVRHRLGGEPTAVLVAVVRAQQRPLGRARRVRRDLCGLRRRGHRLRDALGAQRWTSLLAG